MTPTEELLGSIHEASIGIEPNAEQMKAIHDLLWDFELDEESAVPPFFLSALEEMLEGETTEWITFPVDGYDFSNLFSFLAEIDRILPAAHEHREESVIVSFPRLDMEICFFVESNQYQVRPLGD